jgi:hypothetical protein
MKKKNLVGAIMTVALIAAMSSSTLFAQDEPTQEKNQIQNQVKVESKVNTQTQTKGHGNGFVDLNKDGYNDNAIDSDGDGIPNCQDPDFVRPQNGSGQKKMNGMIFQNKFGGNRYCLGNGVGPKDGTGNGSGNHTGICDGTGPKGHRGGRK